MQIESATLSLDVALEPSARFVPQPVAETAASGFVAQPSHYQRVF
ncbi:hypothetical protein ALT785_370131 [Alteromonas infernus]